MFGLAFGRAPRKRWLLLCVGVLLVATMTLAGAASAQSVERPGCSAVNYTGAGTADDPYELSDISELACIDNTTTEATLNDSYVLGADINATDTGSWYEGRGFDPLGRCVSPNASNCTPALFTGTLDGNGHSITGLSIDRPEENQTGLFSVIGLNGTVQELRLDAVDITGGEFNSVGGLVGSNGGTVSRTAVTGEVSGENFNVGGLVGSNVGTVRRS
ncbi:MAG: hypothetical protein J07HN6_00983, partial [Halonotius sp. J07HN6]